MGFDVEVLAIARAHRYRIKRYRSPGQSSRNQSRIWNVPQKRWETVRVGINRLTGRYTRLDGKRFRKDPVSQEWVLLSSLRAKRPHDTHRERLAQTSDGV